VLQSLADQIASELLALRASSRLRSCTTLAGTSRVNVILESEPLISFCSNDYLGLACDPRLQTAASQAASASGFGAGASRLVCGTQPEHIALENALATFLRLPAALLFPTGYQANLGVLGALAGPDDLLVADRAVHASLLDGCRLSRAKLAIYPHLDVDRAHHHLSRLRPRSRRRFLITESLFSMDGDVAPLAQLAAIATANDAALIVDEAHAFGCLGPSGRGLCAQMGVQPDVLIGTLGKAIGASGAFVAGTSDLRHYLLNRARTFIFTTGLPVPVAAAAQTALQIIASSEGDRLRHRLSLLAGQLRSALGLPEPSVQAPILPFTIGSDQATLDASHHLRSRGFFVQAIRPPTVREGTSRLRITLSSGHTNQQVADLADALADLPAIAPAHQVTSQKRDAPKTTLRPATFPLTAIAHGIFLLGTDTAVGKTTVAAALLHLLANRGAKPVPFKPVETGARPFPSDAARLLAASMRTDLPLGVVCPITFQEPVAAAAASLGSPLTISTLLGHARRAATYGDPLVVESAGGVLSPYAPALTSLDLAEALGFPVLLVARNGLGTINHTALAIGEIRRRQVQFLGTVLVTTLAEPTPDQQSNLRLIADATGQQPLGVLPYIASPDPADLVLALTANVELQPILEVLGLGACCA